jgi:IMP dehydrogenase/GMP reductase
MGSVEAMEGGSKDRYFQDVEDDVKKLVPEGIVGRVPYKGELNESMLQFIGGLVQEWGTAVLKTSQLYRKRDVLFVLQQVVSTKVTRIM